MTDLLDLAPACATWPRLFDSIELGDHAEARRRCLDCDYRPLCRDVALTNPEASGTYGGDLFKDGRMIASLETL